MHEWKKSEKLQSFEQFMGYLRPFLLRPCVVVTQKCIALEFEIRLLLSFRHKTSKKVSKKKLLCTKLSVSLFEESKFVRRGGGSFSVEPLDVINYPEYHLLLLRQFIFHQCS